jgi:hypothetical protein
MLCVATVQECEHRLSFAGKQRVDHASGDTAPSVLRLDDQRGQLTGAVPVAPYLRHTDDVVVRLGDDERPPIQGPWVEPRPANQSIDRGLVANGGSPDAFHHGFILAGWNPIRADVSRSVFVLTRMGALAGKDVSCSPRLADARRLLVASPIAIAYSATAVDSVVLDAELAARILNEIVAT